MTGRYVITGGPSSGKTTLIEEFRSRGHKVLEEIARIVISKRQGYEATNEEWDIRQRMILERQLKQEKTLGDELTFLDRGIIDNYAYFMLRNNKIPEDTSFPKCDYSQIFVLDRLPLVYDGLRTETEEEAERVHRMLINAYKKFGYAPVHVPVMSVDRRVDFILKNIQKLKGGKK